MTDSTRMWERPVARRRPHTPTRTTARRLAATTILAALGAACSDNPMGPFQDPETPESVEAVKTSAPRLAVEATSGSEAVVRWTEVDDGSSQPAVYTVRYASPRLAWAAGETLCEVEGGRVGEERVCSVDGLEAGERYEFQLRAHRVGEEGWQAASFSNLVALETEASSTSAPALRSEGIWISERELHELPTSGAAWQEVVDAAQRSCGKVDLSDQEQMTNVCVLAKALVHVRTGDPRFLKDILAAIDQIASLEKYRGRALSLGRELGTYVMVADLIGLANLDEELDRRFRSALERLRRTWTSGAATNLVRCHEKRPNNWGAHCGATRIAIAIYLGDDAELERAARVFRGYIGDRSAYSGFEYGPDLTWQCDPRRPVGINPAGCQRDGLSLDGVLPDDQRRGGRFTKRPPRENYVWEALQGLVVQAVMLERQGYPAFEWEDRALLRAARWLHDVNDFPAVGDDTWIPAILNHHYGTSFPVLPGLPGKNLAWAAWTHP